MRIAGIPTLGRETVEKEELARTKIHVREQEWLRLRAKEVEFKVGDKVKVFSKDKWDQLSEVVVVRRYWSERV